MKAHDEKCFAAETHREMGVVGIMRDARVGALAEPLVLVAQRLEPLPQALLILGFVGGRAFLKQHDQRLEQRRLRGIAARKLMQCGQNAQIIPRRAEVARDDKPHAVTVESGLGADTGKCAVVYKGGKFSRKRVVAIVRNLIHDLPNKGARHWLRYVV